VQRGESTWALKLPVEGVTWLLAFQNELDQHDIGKMIDDGLIPHKRTCIRINQMGGVFHSSRPRASIS
jgi:hypothetical protein